MPIYLQTVKQINNLIIKERCGKDFKAIKRYQNMPRYLVVTLDNKYLEEFRYLKSAEKFCRNTTDWLIVENKEMI